MCEKCDLRRCGTKCVRRCVTKCVTCVRVMARQAAEVGCVCSSLAPPFSVLSENSLAPLSPQNPTTNPTRRFYSNAYTDAEKQDAINLFLGNYVPLPGASYEREGGREGGSVLSRGSLTIQQGGLGLWLWQACDWQKF